MKNDTVHNIQFSLSHELLRLLKWLSEHHVDELKHLIALAVDRGLRKKDSVLDDHELGGMEDEIHTSIVDFLYLLESLYVEVSNERSIQHALERSLMPSIDRIDGSVCDYDTVQTSVNVATSQLEKDPNANPKELLLKELLRCWKPGKDSVKN